jgi:DNA-directed RNA polymerase specialized sigma24 family protein
MHYFSGFTFDEIAQETGLTVRQVRVRFERGMAWLTRALRGRKDPGGGSSSEATTG